MADFETAITYILASEGGMSNNKNDRGGKTKFGISSPVAKFNGFNDVAKITLEDALKIYHDTFWIFGGVKSDRLATKLLDIYVNLRPRAAIKVMQRAAGCRVDGAWGPQTLRALNGADEDDLLDALSTHLADWYVEIVENDTTQLEFLKGWIRRAIRKPPRGVVLVR